MKLIVRCLIAFTLLFFTYQIIAATYIKGPALIEDVTSTVTAAGTTTLTKDSQTNQTFTGTSTQTVVLPDATTLPTGRRFYITNRSTGTVTVNFNGGSLAKSLTANSQATFILKTNAVAAGTWDVSNVSVASPSGVLPIANGGTNSSTALNNSRVMVSTAGAITESTITTTELGYLDNVTSDIQTQLNGKLSLTGGTMTGAILLDNAASASLPDLAFDGDANSGFYSPGSDTLGFATGGSSRMTINSVGRVGIGVASASYSLEIQGGGGTDGNNGIKIQSTNAAGGDNALAEIIGLRNDGNVNGTFAGTVALAKNRNDAATATGSALGRIMFGGNHTDGSSANILYTASMQGMSEGTFTNSTTMPTGLAFYTGSTGSTTNQASVFIGTERVRINNTGLVGVGLSSPTAKIHQDSGTSTATAQKFTAGTTTGQTASDGFNIGITSTGVADIRQLENLSLQMGTNNAVNFEMTGAGKMSMGDTSGSGAQVTIKPKDDDQALVLIPFASQTVNMFEIADTIGTGLQVQADGDLYLSRRLGYEKVDDSTASGASLPAPSKTSVYFIGSFTSNTMNNIVAPTSVGDQFVILQNASANDVVVVHNSGGTAADRIMTPTGNDVVWKAGSAIALQYNGTGSRWRMIGTDFSSFRNQTPLKLYEGSSGTNYTGFQAPASLSADVMYTLPSADGTPNQVLATNGSGTLSWQAPSGPLASVAPIIQKFTSGSGTYNKSYVFVVSSASATAGATYTNNSITFTVSSTISGATTLITTGTGDPLSSGTLTKASGTGDATITFSAFNAPLYLEVSMVGGGGGGGGGGSAGGASGGAGGNTTFGTTLLVANGGGGGAARSASSNSGGTASLGTGPVGVANQGAPGTGGTSGSTTIAAIGGSGGSSPYGGAGGNTGSGGAGSAAITNTGSGGGGGGTSAASGTNGGYGGAAGGFVQAVIYSPSATYSYAVGAAGSSGSAGTDGFAGAAGGSGIIVVTERFQ